MTVKRGVFVLSRYFPTQAFVESFYARLVVEVVNNR